MLRPGSPSTPLRALARLVFAVAVFWQLLVLPVVAQAGCHCEAAPCCVAAAGMPSMCGTCAASTMNVSAPVAPVTGLRFGSPAHAPPGPCADPVEEVWRPPTGGGCHTRN